MNKKIIIGITQGDINGIGYEVIIKALADARLNEICIPIVYGSSKIFGLYKNQIPEVANIATNVINSARDYHHKRINIINCIPQNVPVEYGVPTKESASAAIDSLEAAVADLKAGFLDAIVTAPFNKKSVAGSDFNFVGHTEYLIKEFEAEDGLMFMCSDTLKVGLVTDHVPINKISSIINQERIIKKLRVMNESLLRDFNIVRPKIAVLGLNPHCGDNGLVGEEDLDIIVPAIKKANEEGILAFGPFPADGYFAKSQNSYDAVLAMYHDQGLIPFKTISFETGVNFTAGLPIVRTSPDHGTAYEIVGKNLANQMSMLSSIYMAVDVVRNRRNYDAMHEDVLQVKFDERSESRRGIQ